MPAGSGLETPPQRWLAKRQSEVVLRLLQGEALDALSRQAAVPIPRLEEWRSQALAGMETPASSSRPMSRRAGSDFLSTSQSGVALSRTKAI